MSTDTRATGLYRFTTATWALDFSFMVQLQNPGEAYEAPVPCYLVEHPEGTVLFDTGVSPEMKQDPETYGPNGAPHMADFVPALDAPEERRPTRQLADVGYEPGDVDHVVLSHLHTDHAGNVTAFPDSEIIVDEDELNYAWWPKAPAQGFFYLGGDFLPLRGPEYDVTTINGSYDVFGDGSVEVIPAPGHSPGHQVLKVDLASEGTVILGADLANHTAGLENEMGPSFAWSLDDTVDSMRKIRRVAEREDAPIYISHDRDNQETLPDPPEKLS